MGNAFQREYDVKEQVASGGPAFLWKIYAATKKTTKQPVSIFILERKGLQDNKIYKQFSKIIGKEQSKKHEEKVFEVMKKEASQLTKLRHPNLLSVLEAVDESRSALGFVSEPVVSSLANLLKKYHNLPTPIPQLIEKYDLHELEIQKGLIQLASALQFCHDSAKIVHLNLVPESIYINEKGDWKLAGFNFSTTTQLQPDGTQPTLNEFSSSGPEYEQPCLNFTAPEYITRKQIGPENDMFGFGCLMFTLYHKDHKPPLDTSNNIQTYNQQLSNLVSQCLSLPAAIQDLVRNLLTLDPTYRIRAADIPNHPFFNNVLLNTLKYLDSLCEKTSVQKAQFYKGLKDLLPSFPVRLRNQKILSCLLGELKDNMLISFVLPNIISISEEFSKVDFEKLVFNNFKDVFKVKDPPQSVIALVDMTEFFMNRISRELFRDYVVVFVSDILEVNAPSVQLAALKVLPTIAQNVDYTSVKNTIFPKITNAYTQTTALSVKVQTLACCKLLLKILDKATIVEKLLPMMKNTKTRESRVLLECLGIYEEVGLKVVDKEVIALDIIPELWKMGIDSVLKVEQFKEFLRVIKALENKVEQDHLAMLTEREQLDNSPTSVTSQGAKATSPDNYDSFLRQMDEASPDIDSPFAPPSEAMKSSFSAWGNLPMPSNPTDSTMSQPPMLSKPVQPIISNVTLAPPPIQPPVNPNITGSPSFGAFPAPSKNMVPTPQPFQNTMSNPVSTSQYTQSQSMNSNSFGSFPPQIPNSMNPASTISMPPQPATFGNFPPPNVGYSMNPPANPNPPQSSSTFSVPLPSRNKPPQELKPINPPPMKQQSTNPFDDFGGFSNFPSMPLNPTKIPTDPKQEQAAKQAAARTMFDPFA